MTVPPIVTYFIIFLNGFMTVLAWLVFIWIMAMALYYPLRFLIHRFIKISR